MGSKYAGSKDPHSSSVQANAFSWAVTNHSVSTSQSMPLDSQLMLVFPLPEELVAICDTGKTRIVRRVCWGGRKI